MPAFETSRMRLNMGYAEGNRLKSSLSETDNVARCTWEFCFCVTCSGNSCGHY